MLIKILIDRPIKKTILFATTEKFETCRKTIKLLENWMLETFPNDVRKTSFSYTWTFISEK